MCKIARHFSATFPNFCATFATNLAQLLDFFERNFLVGLNDSQTVYSCHHSAWLNSATWLKFISFCQLRNSEQVLTQLSSAESVGCSLFYNTMTFYNFSVTKNWKSTTAGTAVMANAAFSHQTSNTCHLYCMHCCLGQVYTALWILN